MLHRYPLPPLPPAGLLAQSPRAFACWLAVWAAERASVAFVEVMSVGFVAALAAGMLDCGSHDGTTAPGGMPANSYVNVAATLSPTIRVVTANPVAKQIVTFDGSGSAGPAPMTSFRWTWGDSSAAVTLGGPTGAVHSWAANGSYQVTLTVTDSTGATGSTSATVVIGGPTLAGVDSGFTVTPSAPVTDSVVTFGPRGGAVTGASAPAYRWVFPDGTVDTNAVTTRIWHSPVTGVVTLVTQYAGAPYAGAPARREVRQLSVVRAARFVYHAGDNLSALGATFTRTTTATYVDSTGLLRTAAANVPRDAHYEGGQRTLLLEGARTNAWPRSEDFAGKLGRPYAIAAVTTANAGVAPNGATTATLFAEDTTNTAHNFQDGVYGTAGVTQTFSFYVKPAGRQLLNIDVIRRAYSEVSGYVNVATCTPSRGAAAIGTVRMMPFANGWCRAAVTANFLTGAGRGQLTVTLARDTLSSMYYKGDGTSGVYFWGGQWDADATTASSYIPTSGTTPVTRAADQLSFTWTAPPQAATAYVNLVDVGTAATAAAGGNPHLLQIGAPFTANLYRMYAGPSGYSSALKISPSGSYSFTGAGIVQYGSAVEFRGILNADGSVLSGLPVGGGAETTGSLGSGLALPSTWSAQTLFVGGSEYASGVGFGAFRRVVIQPYARTLAEMRAY